MVLSTEQALGDPRGCTGGVAVLVAVLMWLYGSIRTAGRHPRRRPDGQRREKVMHVMKRMGN